MIIDYLPERRQCELFVVPHMTLTMPWPIHSFLHFCPEFLFLSKIIIIKIFQCQSPEIQKQCQDREYISQFLKQPF